ncbi:HAD-IIB family hydrolase ['Camptotheca acuminata' phytoplasma]|uniref:HAD-IIB family hydrolase n=1 Tax='Camptotheca acuminata' phytoplasma TaxID=3239192 RepID=UPI00351AAD22
MSSQKRIFFFDIDNTLLSSRLQTIFPQTIKTIQALHKQPDTILGIATGRNIKRLHVLGEIRSYFEHLVLFNGGLTLIDDKVIDDQCFKKEDIQQIIEKAHQNDIKIGMTGLHEEIVPSEQDLIDPELGNKYFTNKNSILAPDFYFNNKVYQIWLFEPDIDKLKLFIKNHLEGFQIYFWRTMCGIDIVPKGINKIHGIKKIQELYPEHQLICMGDGVNDIDMVKYADVGIGLANSDYDDLKNNAQFVAPHVEEDKLYDFFEKNNLL